jgi:hypothetical protein
MSKNSLLCFVLFLLFQLLVEVNCHVLPYPDQSFTKADTATFIDNKLYFLGGSITTGKEFFYLDFSAAFNTRQLLWINLLNIYTVPLLWSTTSAKGGANNNTLFLYGGYPYDNALPLVYTYDTESSKWHVPTISGSNDIRKRNLVGVIDYNGKMYLWGGLIGKLTDEVSERFDNHMLILDTVNLNWGQGSLVGAPPPRIHYGAALLPNKVIIYIGEQSYFFFFL